MAKDSLYKNTSKLNLTHHQASLFQRAILIGNQMSEMLAELEFRTVQPKTAKKLSDRWCRLMVRFVKIWTI